MSKYEPLWNWIKENKTNDFSLTYLEIEAILGFKIDHSFLTYKKELESFGYCVDKISMKEKTILIKKQK